MLKCWGRPPHSIGPELAEGRAAVAKPPRVLPFVVNSDNAIGLKATPRAHFRSTKLKIPRSRKRVLQAVARLVIGQ